MTELVYENLSPEQLDYLVDDCGKPGFLNVPDFVFKQVCRRHDFDYYIGNTKNDRLEADRRMYYGMVKLAGKEPWWKRWYLYSAANVYYYAVRAGSSSFFYYGPRKRTIEDLNEEMALNSTNSN